MEITLDFIQTRIREQEEHIEKLMGTPLDALRKIELLDSAKGVLKYWQEKEYERTIGQTNQLIDDLSNLYDMDVMKLAKESYRDQLASVLPPSEEFESMAAKITQPFSLQQVLG